MYGVPKGIRTPVAAVKGQCPRPLDDGDMLSYLNQGFITLIATQDMVELRGIEPRTSAMPLRRSPS
jgi:hypothetical protein